MLHVILASCNSPPYYTFVYTKTIPLTNKTADLVHSIGPNVRRPLLSVAYLAMKAGYLAIGLPFNVSVVMLPAMTYLALLN